MLTHVMLPSAGSPPSAIRFGSTALYSACLNSERTRNSISSSWVEYFARALAGTHRVREDSGAFGDDPHRRFELVEGAIGEPAAVEVHERTGGRGARRVVVRPMSRAGGEERAFLCPDAGPRSLAKDGMIAPSLRCRDAGTERQPLRQPMLELRVEGSAPDGFGD